MEVNGAVFIHNMPLPGFADHFARSIVTGVLARHVGLQPFAGGDDRLAFIIRAETDVFDQRRQVASHGPVFGIQLLEIHIVGRPDQALTPSSARMSVSRGIFSNNVARSSASGKPVSSSI